MADSQGLISRKEMQIRCCLVIFFIFSKTKQASYLKFILHISFLLFSFILSFFLLIVLSGIILNGMLYFLSSSLCETARRTAMLTLLWPQF